MKILVTGSKGMLGKALCNNLKNIRDGKDKTRPNLFIEEVYEYNRESSNSELEEYCKKADFVFNLAGLNRSENKADFIKDNILFTKNILDKLKKHNNKAKIMFSSSIQASLCGRFGRSDYGISKRETEDLLFEYKKETGVEVYVYRFVNIMGHSKPNYNSAISTFCWSIANNIDIKINDRSIELEIIYIEDLILGMLDLLEGEKYHCEFNGLETIIKESGRYCCVPVTHKVTLGEIADLLEEFKLQPINLMMPKCPDGSFAKKLFSLYLSYLPKDKFKYKLKMNIDERGSFTELMHTEDCGQVSVNVIKPGVTKGEHWHNTKWEQFIVVYGRALIKERNINTGEIVEFEVSGDNIESIYMIPGWTHNITNLSDKDNLVTIMTCNENFNPNKPDTFYEKVN